MHEATRLGWRRAPVSLSSLDQGLLVGADDEVPVPDEPLGALIEIQNGDGLTRNEFMIRCTKK
jgi:hypothetical protein